MAFIGNIYLWTFPVARASGIHTKIMSVEIAENFYVRFYEINIKF